MLLGVKELARARLGSARRQRTTSGTTTSGASAASATVMRSSLREPSASAEDTEGLDGLCAAFGTTRLRVQECRVDRA